MKSLKDGYWRSKTLDQLSVQEWEALCDGCGKCCLLKLEDEDTGEIFSTDIGCKFLDLDTCKCSHYERRTRVVNDCVKLSPTNIHGLDWLPESCSYRVIARGEDLPDWHHLVSGSQMEIHRLGYSIRGWVISESDDCAENAIDRIIQWVD